MNILQVIILVFCTLELLNILVLYTKPGMKEGNGVGIFKVMHELDEEDRTYFLVKYLINWVANVKLIFVALAITIVIFGTEIVQFHAVLALIFSTFMFYVTLYPILKKLDDENLLITKGYSRTLAFTILSFILMFIAAIIIFLVIGT